MSLKDDILNSGLKRELVDVPQWGVGPFYVRQITMYERLTWSNWPKTEDGEKENFLERVLVQCLVDEAGDNIFQPEEYNLLINQADVVMGKVVAAAFKINGIGNDSDAEKKD